MNFAAPSFLYFLALIPLPLILHLFFKRRRADADFSSLLFFAKKERFLAYRRKLREILLLAARCAILALLVLAFARPAVRSIPFLPGSRTAMTLLLDDTMSMQRTDAAGRTLFESALRAAETLPDQLKEGDTISLIRLSGRPGIEPVSDKNEFIRKLRAIPLTACDGDIARALENACSRLRSLPAGMREIYLLTDLQKSLIPPKSPALRPPPNTSFFLLPFRGEQNNLRIAVPPEINLTPRVGVPLRIPFHVLSRAASPRKALVTLEIAGTVQARKTIETTPGVRIPDEFEWTPKQTGHFSGRLILADEAIPLDNVVPFQLEVSDPVRIPLLSPDGSDTPFFYLIKALEPKPDAYGFRTECLSFDALSRQKLTGVKLAFAAPGNRSDPKSAALLTEFVREGGTLLLLPDGAKTPRFARNLTDAGNGKIPRMLWKEPEKPGKGLRFRTDSMRIWNERLNLDLVRVRKPCGIHAPGSEIIAEDRNGVPLIAGIPYGCGSFLVFSFGLRRKDSNWPELKSFPVLMNRLANRRAGDGARWHAADCGETFRQLNGPDLPAFQTLPAASGEHAVFLSPEQESNPDAFTPENFAQKLAVPFQILEPGADPAARLAELRRGTDLTPWFLLVALALLSVEFAAGSRRFLQFRIHREDNAS